MMIQKIIYGMCTLVLLIMIFSFSNQNGEDSKKLTIQSIDKVINTPTNKVKENKIKENKIKKWMTPVRKSAHFFEYMMLGIFVFLFLREFQIPVKWLVLGTLSFCFFYACTDEFHQLFVIGRTARFIDVIIDGLGATLGLCSMLWLKRKTINKKV